MLKPEEEIEMSEVNRGSQGSQRLYAAIFAERNLELLPGAEDTLKEVLDTLLPQQQRVLRLRFGLEDGRARTLEEIGREFQRCRERIRQIEGKALRRLRHSSRSKKLCQFFTTPTEE